MNQILDHFFHFRNRMGIQKSLNRHFGDIRSANSININRKFSHNCALTPQKTKVEEKGLKIKDIFVSLSPLTFALSICTIHPYALIFTTTAVISSLCGNPSVNSRISRSSDFKKSSTGRCAYWRITSFTRSFLTNSEKL